MSAGLEKASGLYSEKKRYCFHCEQPYNGTKVMEAATVVKHISSAVSIDR